MAKSTSKNKQTNKIPEAQVTPPASVEKTNAEPEIAVMAAEPETVQSGPTPIGFETPEAVSKDKIQPSEDRKYPVSIRFDHGFWCPALQKSFMPGFYAAKDYKELKLLAPYGTIV